MFFLRCRVFVIGKLVRQTIFSSLFMVNRFVISDVNNKNEPSNTSPSSSRLDDHDVRTSNLAVKLRFV
jgi:hypothetical protein